MLDILRPGSSKAKTAPTLAPRPVSPSASPASSTSTLKASSSYHARSDNARSSSKAIAGSARSKGQQARRLSIESAVSSSHRHKSYTQKDSSDRFLEPNIASSSSSHSSPRLAPLRRSAFASDPHAARVAKGRSKPGHSSSANTTTSSVDPYRDDSSRTRKRSRAQSPLLGGLYFSDLIVVAFFYAVNLLRTCGIAELVDVAFKAFAYVCTRLPFDFYQRWSLSRPSSSQYGWYQPLTASSDTAHHQSYPRQPRSLATRKEPASAHTSATVVSAIASSSDEETTSHEGFEEDAQLSPFHHLTLLLVRFACTSFPHLVPRVLFAEETIGPLVRWRTGGGAAGIVREFTSDSRSPESSSATAALPRAVLKNDPLRKAAGTASSAASSDRAKSKPKSSQTYTRPGFRAFWIGADAHVPVEVRRSDPSSKSASTLLYLHGGGFSLGSVAFYAEALIRIVTKVCAIEERDNDARCVAVEYDLGPTSRFPGPLLQCLRCYAHLVEVEGIDPACITIAGDSAGGNLSMAMLLCLDGQARGDARLAERDWSSLPMPGKAILISPWADLRPSSSLAFAPLRQAAAAATSPSAAASLKKPTPRADGDHHTRSDHSRESSNVGVSAWTEAIVQHEWDYVAAEALMHFAQLYAGVLKTPRRVRGPMGWVANMCAVLAGDDQDTDSPRVDKKATHSATAPLAILRTLLSPPQRVARAAHSILTEPLLNRANTAAATFSPRTRSATDAFNQVHHVRSTAAGALDPIFPAEERETDAVASTADLYIPIWNDQLDDVQQGKAKRGSGDPDFEQAKALLETSKLINPAIGDWSRIKLKHGMLVLWGDRERLADDIEVWIDRVRQSQSTRSQLHDPENDKPGQDSDSSSRFSATPNSHMHTSGQTLQERRAASRSPHRLPPEEDERVVDWLCTAVEHGPGGVHAWPFVSMYLAGSEAEREKGLEIIARFIAEPAPSPASSLPPTPTSTVTSFAVQLPDTHHHRHLSTAANSPPHLNAVSPAGSMPSDISHGDEDENDYPFPGSSYTDSEGWDPSEHNELGLEGVYPHETIWTQPTPTPSTGMGTPLNSDLEHEGLGHDELVHRVGLGLGGHDAAQRTEHAATMMEPVHLHRPAQAGGSTWNQPSRSEERATLTQSHGRASSAATARHTSAQSLGGSVGGRSLAELEAESDMSAPPSRPDSPGSAGREDEGSYDSRDDDDDDADAPSPQELDRDAFFGAPVAYADDAIPMDPGFYGLAHYHTLRPEGLSDIAEEESQFDTSSVLSSGGNGGSGALSPGSSGATFSPEDGRSPNVGATRAASSNASRYAAGYTPSAAEMARLREALDERERQYQQRFARSAGRFHIEDEDELLGNDDGSNGDVDWLDMDHAQQQQQQQQAQSPWMSSAELPNIGSINRSSVTAGADARTSVSKPVGGSEPRPSPQPRRSNDLQDSGAPDVWW